MKLSEIYNTINSEIIARIISHQGLSIFASEKAKFEGWLKVELTEILKKKNYTPIPETDGVDIVLGNIAIELKTINTNYKFENVNPKTKPITDNTDGIVSDIEKLKRKTELMGFVVFVVFPCEHKNKFWQKQLQKIEQKLSEIQIQEFKFDNGIPGVVYYGKV